MTGTSIVIGPMQRMVTTKYFYVGPIPARPYIQPGYIHYGSPNVQECSWKLNFCVTIRDLLYISPKFWPSTADDFLYFVFVNCCCQLTTLHTVFTVTNGWTMSSFYHGHLLWQMSRVSQPWPRNCPGLLAYRPNGDSHLWGQPMCVDSCPGLLF